MNKEITNADFINLANIVLRDGIIPIGEANFKLAKEYAKQEAIGFGRWMFSNGIVKNDSTYLKEIIKGNLWRDGANNHFTTDQLYSYYWEEKAKENIEP